jgi:hypothetical protein
MKPYLTPHASAAERRRFVIHVARRCEHFLRRATEVEDLGLSHQGADYRRLAAFQSADAFHAMATDQEATA